MRTVHKLSVYCFAYRTCCLPPVSVCAYHTERAVCLLCLCVHTVPNVVLSVYLLLLRTVQLSALLAGDSRYLEATRVLLDYNKDIEEVHTNTFTLILGISHHDIRQSRVTCHNMSYVICH